MAMNKIASFFSPLLISLIGIIVTALAIILYHFFLVKYCIRRNQANANTDAQPTPAARPPAGVEKNVLITIPIFTFSTLKHEDFPRECVVCLGEFLHEDTVRFLPNCNHFFHLSCIDEWFEAHDSCPLCRSPILEQKSDVQETGIPLLTLNDGTSSSTSDSDRGSSVSNTSERTSSNVRSKNRLHRQLSLALPRPSDGRTSHLVTGLKRSLSMDQNIVVINLQRENSSTSELVRSQSYATRSFNHLDRMSSRLFKSFSRMRMGKENSATILPY